MPPISPFVVDGHSDALLPVLGRSLVPKETEPRDFFGRGSPAEGKGHVDLPRLIEGRVACESMALFLDDQFLARGAAAETRAMLDTLERLFSTSGGAFFPLKGIDDAERAAREGLVAALVSIEGGEALEGNMDLLGEYRARNVRLLGLTWNRRNELGRGVRAPGNGGLSDFGRQVVGECAKLGIIVDASHLADEAFDDLAAVAELPFVASHTNCRAICQNLRNLDDGRLEAIARKGGLVGLTFVPAFVSPEPMEADLDRFLDHVDHAVAIMGIDHVGFGSDFDGYAPPKPGEPKVIEDASSWPFLADALRDRGYGEDEVVALSGGNWLRVMRKILG